MYSSAAWRKELGKDLEGPTRDLPGGGVRWATSGEGAHASVLRIVNGERRASPAG